ncbi:MAG: nucleotide exchange factor GrpE [Actinomycetota bacterium]
MTDEAANTHGIGNLRDTGDGDLVDPDHDTVDVSTPGTDDTAPGAGSQWVDDADGDDDAERASEIDDVTLGTPRPDVEADLDADSDGTGVDAVLAAVTAERDEFRAIAQRIQADFDNFRRQSAQRAKDDADRATGRLAEAFLPVLDAAEAAYLNHPDEIGPLLNQMLTELKRAGLETLDLDGQPFDPEVAEAVAHEPGSGGEPIVADVLRSGYRWKGKTLRPAMVKTKD